MGLICVTSFMNDPKSATHISELFFQAVMESFLSQSLETGLKQVLFILYFQDDPSTNLLLPSQSDYEEGYETVDAQNCEGVVMAQPTPKK